MMQLRYKFAKHILLVLLMLTVVMTVSAQSRYRRLTRNGVNHYLTLGLQAGEANMLASAQSLPIKSMLGADAQLNFAYELQRRRFFFNVGINARYDLTRNKMKSFIDAFPQQDRYGEAVSYRYHYNDLLEQQQTVMVGIPVQFGLYITPQVYLALGVKAEYPLVHSYSTKTQLSTDGMYDRFIEPFENNDYYGYYAPFTYTRTGTCFVDKVCPWITPSLEVGARFRLKKRVALRLGAYVEYGMPIGAEYTMPYIDYSGVNQDVTSRTKEDLQSNLVINSILDYSELDHMYGRLAVGVKATFLFQLKQKQPCVTCDDDSGIPFQHKRSKKK